MRRSVFSITLISIFMLSSMLTYSRYLLPIDATANAGADGSVCENTTYMLMGTATNYSSVYWTTNGFGTFDDFTLLNAIYTPGIGELGDITLTLTAYGIPPGNNASDDMILTIYDAPEACFTIAPCDSLCINELITFTGTATTTISSWLWDFGDGNVSNVQNPTHTYGSPGVYNVSLIVINIDACVDTTIQPVTIQAQPVCDFTSFPSDTANINETITFTGTGTSDIISWDWDFGDGNIGNGQVVNHTYTTPGFYAISLIVNNLYGCQDTMIRVMTIIDPLIGFTMSPSPSCESFTVFFSGFGGSGPGDYLWDFGDGDTAIGMNVSHIYILANTYTVTLTYSINQVQYSLLVNPLASADAGGDDTICGSDLYTLSGSATNYSSVLWTSSGDGSFDNPTLLTASYTPGSGDITSGSASLTLSAYAMMPCINASSSMTLSIQAAPTADAGADTATCDGASITLDGDATNQGSNLWSTAGDGTFDDPSLLGATYTPGTNDLNNASVVLTLTAYAILPCASDSTDEMLLSLPMQPTSNAGDDDLICNNTPYTLSGSATNYSSVLWTSGGDGSFDDPTVLNATYTPGTADIANGTVTLSLTANVMAPCSNASDDMILNIQQLPFVNAGDDAGICEGETIDLSGNASNYTDIYWNTDGDGSFSDTSILNPTYTPGPGDISNGGTSLTLTATAIAPCTINMVDAMILGIDPMVGTPATPIGPTMVDSYLTPTSEYETQATIAADEYKWILLPTTAGDITGTGLIGLVSWDAAFQGFAYVKVNAFNSCNAITSDSLEIEVTTSVGSSEHKQKQLIVNISPNPCNGNFKLSIQGIDGELELSIMSSQARLIKQTVLEQAESFDHCFDFSHLPKGLYILKLQGENIIHVEKIIIR